MILNGICRWDSVFTIHSRSFQIKTLRVIRSQNPFPRKRKPNPHHGEDTPRHLRSGRHDRLRDFARISKEICRIYATDSVRGAVLFAKTKRAFLRERWTLNHFQSSESRELLIQLNVFFLGREGAPPVEGLKRGEASKKIFWGKDPCLIIIFSILAFLFFFFMALFLGPVSLTEIPSMQSFQP